MPAPKTHGQTCIRPEQKMNKTPNAEPRKKLTTAPNPVISANQVPSKKLGVPRFSPAALATRNVGPMEYKIARKTPKTKHPRGNARARSISPFLADAPITVIVAATPPALAKTTSLISIGATNASCSCAFTLSSFVVSSAMRFLLFQGHQKIINTTIHDSRQTTQLAGV